MYLKCNARIFKEDKKFEVIDFTISSSFETRTLTAVVNLPRFQFVTETDKDNTLVAKKIPIDFLRGDVIRLETFYTDEFGEDKIPYTNNLYVVRTEIDRDRIILYLEDEMFQLKNAKTLTTVHYLEGSNKGGEPDVIQFVKGLIEKQGLTVEVYPKDLEYKTKEYKFVEMSISAILQYLYENYLLVSFWDGTALVLCRPYEAQPKYIRSEPHKYSFLFTEEDQAILEHNLEYFDERNSTIQIQGKNYLKTGKTTTDNVFTNKGQGDIVRKIDAVFYNLDEATFKANLNELISQYDINGFQGDFTTFGNYFTIREANEKRYNRDYANILDTVQFQNAFYSNRVSRLVEPDLENDIYLITAVEISYSTSGIRQVISIGNQVNTQN